MGVKISSLPINSLPYTGAEKIPLVQSGVTKGGTLSSFTNYLSGSLLPTTTFRSASADFAVKNADNNFTNTQTISVVETTKVKFGNFKSVIDPSNANILFGYNTSSTSTGTGNISIGLKSNSTGTDNIVLGTQSIAIDPIFNTLDSSNIAIGTDINTLSSIDYSYNIIIGTEANLTSFAPSQSNNIIIGAGSGCTDNAENNNIAIGFGAICYHDESIAIGNGATTTQSNQLALGNLNVMSGVITADTYTIISIGGVEYALILGSSIP